VVAVSLCEKLQAHVEGKLHRALSVILFNDQGELLLQQRAHSKYHSGGLWTNTCCSHPRPGEPALDAAKRRLFEEMGICCALDKSFDFVYRAVVDKNLIEHEFDHVYFGRFNAEPQLNPEEAAAWKWMGLAALKKDVEQHPECYTAWFKILLSKLS